MISLTEAGSAAQRRFRAQFLQAMRTDLQELTDQRLRQLAVAAETLSSFVDELKQRADR